MSEINQSQPERRAFLHSSAVGAASLVLVSPKTAFSATANSKIEFGVIGCGGRGQFITRKLFQNAEDDVQIVAIQDPFKDRTTQMTDRYPIDNARVYTGMDAYKGLIDQNLDAVVVTSPPYFHPQQVKEAVDAGKHVWLAKPVAVDVHGCQSILESSKKARGKCNFLVDFQTRNSPNYKECMKRVHAGAIGEPVLGHVYYHAGRLGARKTGGMSKGEALLRNWMFDIKLSGDIIVEQNVHVLDVGNWFQKDAHPIKAVGSGGRKARVDVGDCYDHFVIAYTYPNSVKVDFSSAQFTKGYDDLCARMYGSKGTAETHYCGAQWGRGPVRITGDNPWPGVERDNTWDSGVNNNVKDFIEGARTGKFVNHGEYAVNSTLTGVLGRTAAYTGEEVTWDDMIKKNQKFEVEITL